MPQTKKPIPDFVPKTTLPSDQRIYQFHFSTQKKNTPNANKPSTKFILLDKKTITNTFKPQTKQKVLKATKFPVAVSFVLVNYLHDLVA